MKSNEEQSADAHRHGRAGTAHQGGDEEPVHDEGAQRNPTERVTHRQLLQRLGPAIDQAQGIAHRAEVIMDFGQGGGEEQGGGGEDHHVKQAG